MATEQTDPDPTSPPVASSLRLLDMPPRLIETLTRFETAHRRRSTDEMRACFHDQALIESVASDGRALGADETAQALQRALTDGVYAIGDWEYEEITPDVVLSSTGARHRLVDEGMRDGTVWRLIVGRAGLMWRVKLFGNRHDALAHLRRYGADLGL